MRLKVCSLIVALLALAGSGARGKPLRASVPPAPPLSRAGPEYRLPPSSAPLHYAVTLFVDPERHDSFRGEVSIDIVALQATEQLVLHSEDVDILALSVLQAEGGAELAASWTQAQDDTDFLRVALRQPLRPGQRYTLRIAHTSYYSPYMSGAYLSSYVDADGAERFLVTTQLESVSAREVFPCYDEPGLKATFQLFMYAPPAYRVLSNTDALNATAVSSLRLPEVEGYALTAFEKTPVMSSYLLAFVVSDFQYKSNLEHGPLLYPKRFRSFARPTAREQLDFSLDFGQRSLQAMERWVGVPYALSKMDNVAIPDFSAGAMENWGLVTYREDYLLEDALTLTRSRQEVALTMSHENAHMWFGNEVSPAWWDYLWLSEGFATYFEYLMTDTVEPSWRLMEQFFVMDTNPAMQRDALPSTNAMTNAVYSPAQIDANFNVIAYQKAGSVIRMMQHALGADVFQKGLNYYLKSIPKGSATPAELYAGLQRAQEEWGEADLPSDVGSLFDSWARQKGFPLLSVVRPMPGSPFVEVTQSRYFGNTSLSGPEQYWVPLSWASQAAPSFRGAAPQAWLAPGAAALALPLPAQGWFLLNRHATGYYRVMYEPANWAALTEALRAGPAGLSVFPATNRAQLLADAFDFARHGRLPYNVTLDLAQYLAEETDYIPWAAAAAPLAHLSLRMPASAHFLLYQTWIQKLNGKVLAQLGLDESPGDDAVDRLSRALAARLSCGALAPACLARAEAKLRALAGQPQPGAPVEPDLQAAVYCAGLRRSGPALWGAVWRRYVLEQDEEQSALLLAGLACSLDATTLDDFLLLSVDEERELHPEDRHVLVEEVVRASPLGEQRALLFLTDSFDKLQKKVTSSTGTRRIINALGSTLVVKEHIEMFEVFARKWNTKFTAQELRAIRTAREDIASNSRWLQWALPELDSWLLEHAG